MKKYKASTPDAEVIGAALMAYNDAVERDQFIDVLKTYGLTEIDPTKWYPQQLTLDVQKAIKDMPGGSTALVSIGMKIIDNAIFPPMESLEQALGAFASSYPLNFHKQAPDDMISATLLDEKHIQVKNSSPHSDEMIYGYVYSMVRRFAPKGSAPVVKFTDLDAVDGDGETVIDVTWS